MHSIGMVINMNLLTISIVSFLSGVMASMGLGGGMILIIYLTLFASVPQLEAQGINLVFFIPIAVISLILHTKNRLVEWKKAFPAIICGCVFAAVSAYFAVGFEKELLQKLFAGFLVLIGIKELFTKNKSSGKTE